MEIDFVTGDPVEEGYLKPESAKAAKLEEKLETQSREGMKAASLLSSDEGKRLLNYLIANLESKVDVLIQGAPDELKDRSMLSEIRALHGAMASIGMQVKIGKLAADRLAKQEFPFIPRE